MATLGVSVPNFVLAVFLIVLFSFVIPLFPTGGWGSPRDWVLPAVTLALGPLGIIARFTRSSMVEVIRSDYIRTARAKGLAEQPVILKHVLKNALIPIVTLLGPLFAAVGTGSFFVESIFRVPGMGRFFVLSMTGRDYPMIMAVVLIYGVFLALMNLARRPHLWLYRPPHPILASRASGAPAPGALAWRRPSARGSSLWRDAWRRLLRNKLAVAGGVSVDPPVPRRHLRRLPRPVPVHQGQLRQDLRVPVARVPSRHRSARPRRALAHDLRRPRLHAGGAGGAGDRRADRRADRRSSPATSAGGWTSS